MFTVCLLQEDACVIRCYSVLFGFGLACMALIALDGVFMRFDVNNFIENDVCTMLVLKTEGGKY